MPKRRFILQGTRSAHAHNEALTPSTTASPARSDPENARYVKRTYTIRADQDEALSVALARAELGQEKVVQGKKRSEIIEALLDAGGFNQDYIEGKGRLRLTGSSEAASAWGVTGRSSCL